MTAGRVEGHGGVEHAGQRQVAGLGEKLGAADDKGRAAFLEFAAKQVAVGRGMGFAGTYIAGARVPMPKSTAEYLALCEAFAAREHEREPVTG